MCYNGVIYPIGDLCMIIYLSTIDTPDERSKFEQVYIKYKDLMFYVANRILHNTYDAEDAVHQAFLAILKNLGKIYDVESQKTRAFVVVIVERKAIDLLRIRQRSSETALNDEVAQKAVPERLGLDEAIDLLPGHYRNVLTLKYVSGFSTGEISKMLGITSSGVSKLLFRAKEALKKILEGEGVTL